MIISELELPTAFQCENAESLLARMEDCRDKINSTVDIELRFKYIRSWMHCVERLMGLGHTTGVVITPGFSYGNDLSFDWQACGMIGGMVWFDEDGWSTHT